MPLGREQIYAALFNQLQTLAAAVNPAGGYTLPTVSNPPFVYADRRYKTCGTLAKSQYPSFFMIEAGESYERTVMFGKAAVTMVVHIVIQTVIGEDPNSIPATQMNNLCDAIEECVETGAGQFTSGRNRLGPDPRGTGALIQIGRMSGRQALYISTTQGRWSESTMEVELFLPGQ